MFGRFSSARRRRLGRVVVPMVGAALLVGLLPVQSLALPPDPTAAEQGRETLELETLEKETPVTGETFERDLESLKVEVPADQEQPPAGTATAPTAETGTVSFGTATETATATRQPPTGRRPSSAVPQTSGRSALPRSALCP